MKLKKIYCFMLAIILVINSPILAYADSTSGTVSVSGGSIGSGGVEGNSGILKGTALTVLMATLASAGIQVKIAADDYAHGVGAFAYLEQKFNDWDQASGNAWDNYEKYRALNDTKVGEDGSLYIPEEASAIMQKFVNWLYANDNVNELIENPSDTSTINGCYYASTYTFSPYGSYYAKVYNYTAGGTPSNYTLKDVAILQCHYAGSYKIYCYALGAFSSTIWQVGSNWNWGTVNSTSYAGYRYTKPEGFSQSTPYEGLTIWEGDIKSYLNSLNGEWEEEQPGINIDLSGFYGETLDIPQLVDESGNGKILTVQPGLMGQVQDSYVGSNNATVNVQDYLDALKDLYGQLALPQDITDLPDITIPGEDAITGTREDVAVIDREIALNPDITVPADSEAITWPEVPGIAVPVSDPSVPADPDVAIPAMSFDLTDYFPFCIPFDIYNLLSKLNADPVTPVINIDWGDILGSIGVDYEMTIDLSAYNDIAAILRTMELFAFIIGLGVATRSMYIRG